MKISIRRFQLVLFVIYSILAISVGLTYIANQHNATFSIEPSTLTRLSPEGLLNLEFSLIFAGLFLILGLFFLLFVVTGSDRFHTDQKFRIWGLNLVVLFFWVYLDYLALLPLAVNVASIGLTMILKPTNENGM